MNDMEKLVYFEFCRPRRTALTHEDFLHVTHTYYFDPQSVFISSTLLPLKISYGTAKLSLTPRLGNLEGES